MGKKLFLIFFYIFMVSFTGFCSDDPVTLLNVGTDTHTLFSQAQEYYRKGNTELSISKLELIIDIDPMFISAYYLLGKIHKDNNDFEKALFYFERAIRVRQDIGKKEKDLKQMDEVPNIKNKINEVFSTNREAEELCNQALIHIEKGDFVEAQNALKFAIEKNPNKSEYHFRLASVYRDRGLKEEALSSLKKGLKLDTENVNKTLELAELYGETKKYSDAVRLLKRSMEDGMDNKEVKKALAHYSAFIKEKERFIIVKRTGKEVIINAGFRDGLKKGMEFRTHLNLYRGGMPVTDLKTGEVLGYTDETIVGEVLITKVDDKLTYGQVTYENNNKIRIGDYIKEL